MGATGSQSCGGSLTPDGCPWLADPDGDGRCPTCGALLGDGVYPHACVECAAAWLDALASARADAGIEADHRRKPLPHDRHPEIVARDWAARAARL